MAHNSSTVRIKGNGESIIIENGVVTMDGKEVNLTGIKTKNIILSIAGDVGDVKTTSGDVVVSGNSRSIYTTSGDVEIGEDVTGGVHTTSGDVGVEGSIKGSVNTVSGDIH